MANSLIRFMANEANGESESGESENKSNNHKNNMIKSQNNVPQFSV